MPMANDLKPNATATLLHESSQYCQHGHKSVRRPNVCGSHNSTQLAATGPRSDRRRQASTHPQMFLPPCNSFPGRARTLRPVDPRRRYSIGAFGIVRSASGGPPGAGSDGSPAGSGTHGARRLGS